MRVREERAEHIGEERERGPLHVLREHGVAAVDREHDRRGTEDDDEGGRRQTGEHLRGVRHAAEIGGDVEDVRAGEHHAHRDEHRARVAAAQRAGEADAAHQADARAHQLHGDHQRQRDDRGPERRVAVGRAGDRVGRDAARIVVGGSRDQSGTEPRP
jgi:hypothetical protein